MPAGHSQIQPGKQEEEPNRGPFSPITYHRIPENYISQKYTDADSERVT